MTAEKIWFFAPLTSLNRSLFEQNSNISDKKAFCRFIEQAEGTIMVTQASLQAIWVPTGTLYCSFALSSCTSYRIQFYFIDHVNLHSRALTTVWPILNDETKYKCAKRYLKIPRAALGTTVGIYSAIDGICDTSFAYPVRQEKQRLDCVMSLLNERFDKPEDLWEFGKDCPCKKETRNPEKAVQRTIKHIHAVHVSPVP